MYAMRSRMSKLRYLEIDRDFIKEWSTYELAAAGHSRLRPNPESTADQQILSCT